MYNTEVGAVQWLPLLMERFPNLAALQHPRRSCPAQLITLNSKQKERFRSRIQMPNPLEHAPQAATSMLFPFPTRASGVLTLLSSEEHDCSADT